MVVGRLNALYMRWADALGTDSQKCKEVSGLFSRGIDSVKTGERLKIPDDLKATPENHKELGNHSHLVKSRNQFSILQ